MSKKPKRNAKGGCSVEIDGVRASTGSGGRATLTGDLNAKNLKRKMAEALNAPPAPVTFPMTPQEAHAIGVMTQQQRALDAQFQQMMANVCARLGIAIGTRLSVDPERGVYMVGG